MSDWTRAMARGEIFNLKPYIPGKPVEEVQRELGLTDIVKMASNENPLGPSPLAVKALGEALDRIYMYPDANCFQLRDKMAAKLDVRERSIVIGNGSDELLKMIAEAFIHSGDEVIYADPTFAEYEFTALLMGACTRTIPLNNFGHDLEGILAVVNEKTRIIYLCNPNNPTGTVVTQAQLDRFIALLPETVLLVIDEAYGEYATNPEYPDGLRYVREDRPVIVLRTFSKIYGLAALRVGYGVTRTDIAAALERVREPFNVNMLAQVGATAALEDQEHLSRSLECNQQGKDYLYRELGRMGLKWVPTEANFVLVDTAQDCQKVYEQLLRQGIIVRSGNVFGYPTHIRVTVGLPDQNARFIKALKDVLVR
ncbi:MAG TPA: histidinol-phosphate transaminase [Syntrophomonadaceae bacterium]|nr:histidinol-phosphate transaminase [Syntrophomonadaceae bacterium]